MGPARRAIDDGRVFRDDHDLADVVIGAPVRAMYIRLPKGYADLARRLLHLPRLSEYAMWTWLSLVMFGAPPVAAAPAAQFGADTKIAWTLEVAVDEERHSYGEAEIDARLQTPLAHPVLPVVCALALEREHVPYDRTGVRGYTRDEERVKLTCTLDGYALELDTVTCAKGAAKNKVGTVYGDDATLRVTREKKSFAVRVGCVVK